MSKNYKYILDFVGNNRQLINAISQNNRALSDMERNSQKSNSAIGSMFGGLKNMAGAMGLAFGASEVVQFTGELVKLSGEAEGVETAFRRIANTSDLNRLRDSVHGTVSDLELMKRAVSAQNFGIPVKELGNLFAFATKRAQDTGQSVDYLVDSIVTGIGRKSPLILDNLGISATMLKEKLNGVAIESASVGDITKAIGEIAAESFKKTGDILDTNAIKIQNLSARYENFKKQLSTSPGFNSFVSDEIDELSDNMEVFFSENLSRWEKFKAAIDVFGWGGQVEYLANKSRQLATLQSANTNEVESSIATTNSGKEAVKTYANSLTGLNERLEDYKKQLLEIAPADRGALMAKLSQINAIEEQISKIDKLKAAMKTMADDTQSGFRNDKLSTMSLRGYKADYWGKDDNGKNRLNLRVSGSEDTSKWTSQLDPMNAMLDANQQKVDDWKNALIEKQQAIQDAFQTGFQNIGRSVVDGLGLAEKGFEGFVGGLATTVLDLIAMFLSQSIAAAIAGNTTAGAAAGPLAPAMIPAYVATGIAGVMSAFAAIPKFAAGGLAYGPTLGLMGEYPGASSNPEVIAPLSKLQAMLAPSGGTTVILQPGIDFDGDKMRIYLNRIDDKKTKRTGK